MARIYIHQTQLTADRIQRLQHETGLVAVLPRRGAARLVNRRRWARRPARRPLQPSPAWTGPGAA